METYILKVSNALYVKSMKHNLIPPFIMRETGLKGNDVPRIQTKVEDLMDETHCIVANEDDNGADLKIPLKLDGIFSYFSTRKLTSDEINNCKFMETVSLCPEGPDWDPYDSSYANQEDSMVDYKGNVIVSEPKKRKILDSRDVFEISMSEERYEAAVSSIVAANYSNPQDGSSFLGHDGLLCNPQDGDAAFNTDDDYIQSALIDTSTIYNDELF